MKGFEQLRRLRFKACFVQVKQALYRVGPKKPAFAGCEEGVLVTNDVDDNVGRLERIVLLLQCRIEFLDKAEVHSPAVAVERQIESRGADKIEIGVIVQGAKHAADGKVWDVQLFEAAKMGLWGTGLAGAVGEWSRGAEFVGDGEQTGELLAWEVAEADSAIGLALHQVPKPAEPSGHGWIGAARSLGQPSGGYWFPAGEPAMEQEFEDDEEVIRSGLLRARIRTLLADFFVQHTLHLRAGVVGDTEVTPLLRDADGEVL